MYRYFDISPVSSFENYWPCFWCQDDCQALDNAAMKESPNEISLQIKRDLEIILRILSMFIINTFSPITIRLIVSQKMLNKKRSKEHIEDSLLLAIHFVLHFSFSSWSGYCKIRSYILSIGRANILGCNEYGIRIAYICRLLLLTTLLLFFVSTRVKVFEYMNTGLNTCCSL